MINAGKHFVNRSVALFGGGKDKDKEGNNYNGVQAVSFYIRSSSTGLQQTKASVSVETTLNAACVIKFFG